MSDPTFWRCLHAIREQVLALNLEGLSPENVQIRKLPHRDLPCPGVIITPVREQRFARDNERDVVRYTSQVAVIRELSNQDVAADDDFRESIQWYERLTNTFSGEALEGMPEISVVRVVDQQFLLPAAFADNYDIMVFSLEAETEF